MRVYKKGDVRDQWHGQSVGDFVAETVLTEQNCRGGDEAVRLEEQPTRVAESLGRLLDLMLAKGVLTEAEFWQALGVGEYDVRRYWIGSPE